LPKFLMGLSQYIKETRGELNHVAWPTRTQTFTYAAIVMILSVLVSLYLGVFDYVFTNALGEAIERLPQSAPSIQLNTIEDMPTPTTNDTIIPLPVEEQ